MISITQKQEIKNETSGNTIFIVTPEKIEAFISFIEKADVDYIASTEKLYPGTIKRNAHRSLNGLRRGHLHFLRDFNRLAYVAYALHGRMFKREQLIAAFMFTIINSKCVPHLMRDTFNCFVFMLLQSIQQYKSDEARQDITVRDIMKFYKSTSSKRRQYALNSLFSRKHAYVFACEVVGSDTIDEFIAQYEALLFARELK